MVAELISRNITEGEMEKSEQAELGDKDKISSAINTLLSLSSSGLKQLSRKIFLIWNNALSARHWVRCRLNPLAMHN